MRLAFAVIAPLLALASAGNETPAFVVAVVRTDGRLVPFAAWNGASWERAWPQADEAIPPRIGLDSIPSPANADEVPNVWSRRREPIPRIWKVRPAGGGDPFPARVRRTEVVVAHCGAQVALATDLPDATANDPEAAAEGRFGVAVAGPAPVIAIEQVPRSHAMWKEALRVVRAGFDAREMAQAAASRRALPRYAPTPLVQLVTLRRQAGSPRAPLYFESERSYPTGPFFGDSACPARTVMSGWLVRSAPGALALHDPQVFVTDCDGKETRRLFPLGALRAGARSFWVMQEHGWEDEAFVLVEVGPSNVGQVMRADGGGC